MTKPTQQDKPKARPALVTIPVFASHDAAGQVAALAVAGKRDMQVSVRGERVIEVEVERMPSHETISRDLTLEQLVEILKVKMYNEAIADQAVYDLLFGDRLERQWLRTYRAAHPEGDAPPAQMFWKKSK